MARFFIFIVSLAAFSLASTRLALADTVDGSAQPYLVFGSFVVGAAFFGYGLLMIARGRASRLTAAGSVNWPVTGGKILSANVTTTLGGVPLGGIAGRVYTPQVRYAYAVAGKTFEGNVIRPGLEQFPYGIEAQAETHIALYKVGAAMPVHYNPADPSIAVLETAERASVRVMIAGILYLLIGASAFVLAIVFAT